MTTTNILATERPSRARTLALLVSLLAELPAPTEILLYDDTLLQLYFANTADFDEWAAYLRGRVNHRNHRHADTIQCNAYADWCGWRVSLNVVMRVDGDRLSSDEAAEALSVVTE